MKKTNDSFEAVKQEMQQRLGDTTFLTDVLEEKPNIPLETLASMGDTPPSRKKPSPPGRNWKILS